MSWVIEAGALEAELVEQADQQVGLGGDGGVAVEGPLGVAVPEQVVGDDAVACGLDGRDDVAPLVGPGRRAVDEDDGLALAAIAVREPDAVDEQVPVEEGHAG